MSVFHPLYNFIPVTNQCKSKVPYDQIAQGTSGHPIRHDLWQKHTYSGRVLVSIYLETATVVGGQHHPQANGLTQVDPYLRDNKPAIPGNSLRGMIGNLAETLSQSALRVLEDKRYSVRKPIRDALSAIGLLRTSKTNPNSLELLPLTLPVQAISVHQGKFQVDRLWQKVFNDGRTELKYCLPAYVNGYSQQRVITNSFLGKNPNLECFLGIKTAEKAPQFYYARLVGQLTRPIQEGIPVADPALKTTGGNYLLGQKIVQKNGIDDIITKEQHNQLSPSERADYTRGILRILGIAGREEEIPNTKKHELFIPLPPHIEQYLSISEQALDNFITLAEECEQASEKQLPFKPKGYLDWHPQAGQLVFFDIAQNAQGQPYVSEISLSAIWRKAVEGSSHTFFRKIHQDCLPWNLERKALTPAECLFGVVEESNSDNDQQTRALASRVHFSDAQAVTETVHCMPPVTLKILSSPKPPCPAMYFHPAGQQQGGYVPKTKLSDQQHTPNGRKVYLHHPRQNIEQSRKSAYWETCENERLDQKMSCRPMQKGQTFYFHIDFENLSQAELNLLLRSLSPAESYRHRLGLGKSLGLGSVALAIEGLFLIDRLQRYSLTGLDSPRYHQVLRGPCTPSSPPPWAPFYPEEAQSLPQATTNLLESPFYTEMSLINAQTLALLKTVGDPNSLKPETPVSPPLVLGQAPETETFKWFAENDKVRHQEALPAIEANRPLPTLTYFKVT